MAEYWIDVTEDAKADLDYYAAAARKVIVSGIRLQLTHQPLVETRNRKPLRDHPLAAWELRVEKYRVFYEVDETNHTVTVISVGHKEHNVLLVRGKQVPL